MKRVIASLLLALSALAAAWAQTPEEILTRMDQETSRFDAEGFVMVMEIKIPILGTMATTTYTRGDKYKMYMESGGSSVTSWSNGVTDWTYDSSKNELTIENAKVGQPTEADSNAKMLDSITDGYDVRLKKETDDTWVFRCTKSKDNKKKDDPKNIDLVISKTSYLPVSVKTGQSGVTVTLRDFAIGVTENDVTFDPEKYANAKVIDKRQ